MPSVQPSTVSCLGSKMSDWYTPTFLEFVISTSLVWGLEDHMVTNVPDTMFEQVFHGTSIGLGSLGSLPHESADEVPYLLEFLSDSNS